MIKIENLNYRYRTFEKSAGLYGTLKDFVLRKYSEVPALQDINIQIVEGESIGLLGGNGAGKTTLIKLMTGIIEPSEGEIFCLGYNPYQKDKNYLKEIGVVLGQKSQLIWDLPSKETLLMLKVIYNIDSAIFDRQLIKLCEMLGVADKLNIPVRKLSLGERMKFELICALVHSPKILYLDEPTIGLDVLAQYEIRRFLRKINELNKVTIILTSHYMKDIEEISDRVIVLSNGRVIDDSSIISFKDKYRREDKIIIKFRMHIPEILHPYILKDNTIQLEVSECERFMDYISINDIISMTTKEEDFDEIIARLLRSRVSR